MMINWQEVTVHKFMKMCALKNKKRWSILAWSFHFSPLVFDLKDVCLLSNGFKSFGNIFSWSFFMEGWAIYHRVSSSYLRPNRFRISSQLVSNEIFLIFSSISNCWDAFVSAHVTCRRKGGEKWAETAPGHVITERNRPLLTLEHIFCVNFAWKMFTTKSQMRWKNFVFDLLCNAGDPMIKEL